MKKKHKKKRRQAKRHHYQQALTWKGCKCGKPIDHPIHIPLIE